MQEAIDWVTKCPNPLQGKRDRDPSVFEAEDFGEAFTPELREQEKRMGEQIAENAKKK